MSQSKRYPRRLILTLVVYLLLLAGLGGYLLWPKPEPAPLRVTGTRLAPEGDRILLEGEGFGPQTEVSLALDVVNLRFLRHSLANWGRGGPLVREGNHLYAANLDKGLIIFDLTEPERPKIVGRQPLPGLMRALTVKAGVAYVACGKAGLALVDVSTPQSPQLLSVLPELVKAQAMVVRNGRLYAAVAASGMESAVAVVDVSAPQHPRLIDRTPLPGQPLGVALWGEQLLVAAGRAGLISLDLTAGAPRVRSQLAIPGIAHALVVLGEHAYVGCTQGGLAVVELAGAAPRLLDYLPVPRGVNRLFAESGRLYLCNGWTTGYVVDIADPAKPRRIGSFYAPGGIVGGAVKGRIGYFNTIASGLYVVDLSAPSPMQSVSTVLEGRQVNALVQDQDLLAVTTESGQLQLLEQRSGAPPRLLGSCSLRGECEVLKLHAGYAYARIKKLGLEVIDIRTPEAPVVVGFYPLDEDGSNVLHDSLDLAGNRGAVVAGSGRLWLFDTSDPERLQFQPGPDLPASTVRIAWGKNRLYVSPTMGGRLIATDLQPSQPAKAYPAFSLPALQIMDIATLGDLAVLACGLDGLLVVDFSNPCAPRLLSALALPLSAMGIHLDGVTGYIIDRRGGLQHIDLSDPAHPRAGGLLRLPSDLIDFSVLGRQAVLASKYTGLMVVPLPQQLEPLARDERRMILAVPAIDTPGYYTLRLTDGSRTEELPGALPLFPRSSSVSQSN